MRKPAARLALADAVLESFRTNGRINRYLLESVSDAAWRADPPTGKGRPIAAIAAHMHNVRHMWLTVSAKGIRIPPKIHRDTVTRKQAIAALAKSDEAMARLIEPALRGDGRIRNFKPDVAGFIGYLISHEAHHRGQISMLARQVGHPIAQKVMFGMWEWGKR